MGKKGEKPKNFVEFFEAGKAKRIKRGFRISPQTEFKKGHKINLGKKNVLGKHWKVKDSSKMGKSKLGKSYEQIYGKQKAETLKEKRKENKLKYWDKIGRKGEMRPYEHIKTAQYKEWRMKVFLRDNFTCQVCFRRGNEIGELHAHHIEKYSIIEKRYIVENGITLCRECHKLLHKILRKKT